MPPNSEVIRSSVLYSCLAEKNNRDELIYFTIALNGVHFYARSKV